MAQYLSGNTCKLFISLSTNDTGVIDKTAIPYMPTQNMEGLYPRFPFPRYVNAMQRTARDAVLGYKCMDIRNKPGFCSALDPGEVGRVIPHRQFFFFFCISVSYLV